MSALTLLAIVLQLADAGQTCAALYAGAKEGNPLIGSHPTCAKVVAFKAAHLAPLVLPLKGPWRLGVQVGNIGAGSLGVGLSVRYYWSTR